MVTLSIITINFNNSFGLLKTIESIKNQVYKDFELIVIDAASIDNSLEIILKNSNNITEYISEPDEGIYDAMNKGVKLANGEWTVFMNSGDAFFNENTLFELSRNFTNNNANAFYGDTTINYHNYQRLERAKSLSHWKSLPFIHQSFYCRTNFLKKNPFNLKYKICSDYDFFYKIKDHGMIQYIPKSLSVISAGGKSDLNRSNASLEKEEILKTTNSGIKITQTIYFRFEYILGKFVSNIKKIIPQKWILFFTQLKYFFRN